MSDSTMRRLTPYLPDVRQAAREEGIRPALLAAVGLRESWFGWAPPYHPKGTHLGVGDEGNGFGLFQADLRTWELALRGLVPGVDLLTPLGQARLAARHLSSSLRVLQLMFPGRDAAGLEAAAAAAYNARFGRVVLQLVAGAPVDDVTSKGPSGRPDYASDVLRRAAALEAGHPDLFPPASG